MVRNMTVSAAVASVLASGAAMAQLQPTPAQAANPTVGLYISGSSAAKNAVLGALETGASFCGGTFSLFSSTGDTNFFAVSCAPLASSGLPSANGTNVFTIWYRDEGGSVTGALPLVSGSQINQLALAGATGSAGSYSVAVGGASGTNGIDDSFTGGVQKEPVQMGITDVEPAALVGNNYPSAYKSSVYGKATPAQLAGLTQATIFDQVFGVFVNTNSSAFSTAEKAGQGTATASLRSEERRVAAILQGNQTNWNDVPDTSGNAVASSSLPITIVNREQGSGSRTATDLFFTGDHCSSVAQTAIQESTGGTADYFSTGNVLGGQHHSGCDHLCVDRQCGQQHLPELDAGGGEQRTAVESECRGGHLRRMVRGDGDHGCELQLSECGPEGAHQQPDLGFPDGSDAPGCRGHSGEPQLQHAELSDLGYGSDHLRPYGVHQPVLPSRQQLQRSASFPLVGRGTQKTFANGVCASHWPPLEGGQFFALNKNRHIAAIRWPDAHWIRICRTRRRSARHDSAGPAAGHLCRRRGGPVEGRRAFRRDGIPGDRQHGADQPGYRESAVSSVGSEQDASRRRGGTDRPGNLLSRSRLRHRLRRHSAAEGGGRHRAPAGDGRAGREGTNQRGTLFSRARRDRGVAGRNPGSGVAALEAPR